MAEEAVAAVTPEQTAPTPPPASEPANEDVGSDLFSDLADDVGDEDVAAPAQPPAAKAEPVPPAPSTPPAPEPVVAKPAAETPPKAETPPAAPVRLTQEQVMEKYEKDRAAAIAKLIEEYRISEDQAPALMTEPEKVLPQLLANMHARVMDNMAQFLRQNLPAYMHHLTQTATAQRQAVDTFFQAWPELNKPEYHQQVARVLGAYRQANPDASVEDVIQAGGVSAMVALRLPLPERVLQRHNVDKPDAKPVGGGLPPATPGASRPAPSKSNNVFTVLAEEDLADG